jgi:hypothetical protein
MPASEQKCIFLELMSFNMRDMIDREREREPETVIDWYAVVSHSLIRLI